MSIPLHRHLNQAGEHWHVPAGCVARRFGFYIQKSAKQWSRLTPASSIPLPSFGETFIHQCLAEALAAASHDSEFPTVLVFITICCFQAESTGIQQNDQTFCGSRSKLSFRGTLRFAHLGRVNVRDPNLLTLEPEGVAIDDATKADRAGAFAEVLIELLHCRCAAEQT